MAEEKISVYNLADLKNTSDDAIPNYLNSLGFQQSHRLVDVRLALGYGAFTVAGACFYWDYKLGFTSTKYYSAAALVLYMALNTALAFWSKFVEKSIIYEGKSPASSETISISTSCDKYTPVYNVTVTTTSSSSPNTKPQTESFKLPFSEWFDGTGQFVALPFQTIFASKVAAIGRVDSKRAQPASKAPSTAQYDAETLNILAAAQEGADSDTRSGEQTAVATGSSSQKKGGKRRKA